MNIRADLNINGTERKMFLSMGPNEPADHVAHRLAASILFWDYEPMLDASTKTPALNNFEFLPDLLAVDPSGEATLWVECGSVTMNKLTKVTRRMPRARLVIIKETEREASQLRKALEDQFDRPEKVEILAWPDKSYKQWVAVVKDRTEAFGEASGNMLNIVINETMLVVEFKSY
jgi:YaeQ protein